MFDSIKKLLVTPIFSLILSLIMIYWLLYNKKVNGKFKISENNEIGKSVHFTVKCIYIFLFVSGVGLGILWSCMT